MGSRGCSIDPRRRTTSLLSSLFPPLLPDDMDHLALLLLCDSLDFQPSNGFAGRCLQIVEDFQYVTMAVPLHRDGECCDEGGGGSKKPCAVPPSHEPITRAHTERATGRETPISPTSFPRDLIDRQTDRQFQTWLLMDGRFFRTGSRNSKDKDAARYRQGACDLACLCGPHRIDGSDSPPPAWLTEDRLPPPMQFCSSLHWQRTQTPLSGVRGKRHPWSSRAPRRQIHLTHSFDHRTARESF
jgi:hypothetical protein